MKNINQRPTMKSSRPNSILQLSKEGSKHVSNWARHYSNSSWLCCPCDKPNNWVPETDSKNKHVKLIYQVSIQGHVFLVDSACIWHKLKKLLMGKPTKKWIKHLDSREDDRLGFQTIQDYYKGCDMVDCFIVIAEHYWA